MIFWLITFTFISNLFPKDAEVHPHEEPLQLTKFLRNPDYFFVTLLVNKKILSKKMSFNEIFN